MVIVISIHGDCDMITWWLMWIIMCWLFRTSHVFRNYQWSRTSQLRCLFKVKLGIWHQLFVPHNGFEFQLWIGSIEEKWTPKWVRDPYDERYSKWVRDPYDERYSKWVRVTYELRLLKWVRVPWIAWIHKKVESYEHAWTESCPRRRSGQGMMFHAFE